MTAMIELVLVARAFGLCGLLKTLNRYFAAAPDPACCVRWAGVNDPGYNYND